MGVPTYSEIISGTGDIFWPPQHNIWLMRTKSIQREEYFGLLPTHTDDRHMLMCDSRLKQAMLLCEWDIDEECNPLIDDIMCH
jgi:hypothetical protein